MVSELTKLCTICGKRKNFTEFIKDPRTVLGIGSECKKCKYERDCNLKAKRRKENAYTYVDEAICTKCKEKKPREKFNKDSTRETGLTAFCKKCVSDAQKNYREKSKELFTLTRKRYQYKKQYGLSFEEAEEMKKSMFCILCRRHGVKLSIDHCHFTGKVRGAICLQCNSALGYIRDCPATLVRMKKYLEKSRRNACQEEEDRQLDIFYTHSGNT